MDDIVKHIPRLRRYARALTGDRFLADDLVQDALERALTKFGLWRQSGRLESWLLTILHNVYVNQLHARARRSAETVLDELGDQGAIRAQQNDGLEVRDLDVALARLSPEQRAVLLLVTLEEFSYEDTAKILGIPTGTVMSRLSRARASLREQLPGHTAGSKLRIVK